MESDFVLSMTRKDNRHAVVQSVKDELQRLVDLEGERPLAKRLGMPFGKVRGILDGRDPLASNIFNILDGLGMNYHVGSPLPSETGAGELLLEEVRQFEIYTDEDGYLGLFVKTGTGRLKLLAPPDLAKALADQLTYHAMKIEGVAKDADKSA